MHTMPSEPRKENTCLLRQREERLLIKQAQEGNMEAREKVLLSNMGFVVKIAKRYLGHGLEMSDLISEGFIGMSRALTSFDLKRKNNFISYAVYWIKQSIIQSIAENSRMVRLPLNVNNALGNIKKWMGETKGGMSSRHNSEHIDQMMNIKSLPPGHILNLLEQPLSLDKELFRKNGAEGSRPIDFLQDSKQPTLYDEMEKIILKEKLLKVVDMLTHEEQLIIRKRYFLEDNGKKNKWSLMEIGKKLKLSKERVRQLEERAFKKIRQSTIGRELKNFLPS